MIKRVVTILLLFLGSHLYGISYKEAKRLLTSTRHPFDTKTRGPICERLAYHKMVRRYGSDGIRILTNMEYRVGERIQGELDIVVVDDVLKTVLMVGEVKCQNDANQSKTDALLQLNRFETYVSKKILEKGEHCVIELKRALSTPIALACWEFAETKYEYIFPRGEYHDKSDLGLTLSEIDNLLELIKRK